ncbi:hypothetical protein G9C85_04395 [Halorubellus sp. JP-L1]|uniref:DUF7508 domain-containing protein n=1 Tax=Halorubellus sp. JP-L1 TaxID=2715753 RepID=UPI001408F728|nr:hypothetical protein [Halorubellus sp. JP-L1]NHN40874.1 hypothetical protein [Halorubellus sp. JP-L1]
MPLAKQWRSLDRSTVAGAPDRLGVYEIGDDDGNVLEVDWGVLPDELKDALSYGPRGATQVRWEVAQTREQAESLAAEHRERLD